MPSAKEVDGFSPNSNSEKLVFQYIYFFYSEKRLTYARSVFKEFQDIFCDRLYQYLQLYPYLSKVKHALFVLNTAVLNKHCSQSGINTNGKYDNECKF